MGGHERLLFTCSIFFILRAAENLVKLKAIVSGRIESETY